MHLEACCDYLSIRATFPSQRRSAAESIFTGELTPRHLETGDEGIALVPIQSAVVNVTFVSDRSVESLGFELLVFPFFRM